MKCWWCGKTLKETNIVNAYKKVWCNKCFDKYLKVCEG